MNSYAGNLSRLMAEESGQDLVEYALVAALVALAAIAALSNIANGAIAVLAQVGARLTSAL